MCGICGFSLTREEWLNAQNLATSMLLGIENRGRDATGAAWVQNDEIWVSKEAIAASKFVQSTEVPMPTKTFIGHTRWATKGSPKNNDNNHPIDVRGIVGIHNGCLWNDDQLFEIMGTENRIAEVDSEAIFAWLLRSGLPTTEALQHITGSAAVAWLDATDPNALHLARISLSPLHIAWTANNSLLFASTKECIEEAALLCDLTISSCTSVKEGTHLVVRNGNIEVFETFKPESRGKITAMERKALNLSN